MIKKLVSGCLILLSAGMALAQSDGGIEFSGSGFLTLAAGKVFKGDAPQDFNGYHAPMFASDWGQGGIYERGHWTLNPDSKLGLQGTATFNPRVSVTGQVVSRGTSNGKFDLEWAYLNYTIDDRWTFQLGRKRLPLFYYSETQDVGLAYPWVHLPSGQYGWEIVNYNGANLLYHDQWGSWSSSMNFFAGDETRKNSPYETTTNGKHSHTDDRWSNIVGADMTLTRGWFEARLAYIQSDDQDRFEDPLAPPPFDYSPKARQKIYALSFAVDHHSWVVRNEYLYMDRKQKGEEDYSFLLGAGYRIGKYLPMLTYNRYWMRLKPGLANPAVVDPSTIDPLSAERWTTLAFSLRYDLTPTSALKMQIERWKDQNGPNFNLDASGKSIPYGNARLFSLSYDRVF